jgi:ATP-dependent DNA helicase DinG
VSAEALLREGLVRVFEARGERYEERPGQMAMAQAVERALREERHALIEAGTGTGKTLAYLIPALLSGRKVVVSTATHALQEQLMQKDVPLAQQILEPNGVLADVVLMKGISNYVCRRRLGEALDNAQRMGGMTASLRTSLRVLNARAESAVRGDRSAFPELAEQDPVWNEVLSSSDTRIGAGCAHHDTCFVTRVRAAAAEADVVVVNHHLFFADLVLRTGVRGEYASVLPAYDAVIFDEAHQLEHIATEFFGVRLGARAVRVLLVDVDHALTREGVEQGVAAPERALLASVSRATEDLFASLNSEGQRRDIERRAVMTWDSRERPIAARLATGLRALTMMCQSRDGREGEAYRELARRAREQLEALERLQTLEHETPWFEVRDGEPALGVSPGDIAGTLRGKLFDRIASVILTSATLRVPGAGHDPYAQDDIGHAEFDEPSPRSRTSFGETPRPVAGYHYVKGRLGVPSSAHEWVFASPFAYRERAMLYTPRDLPTRDDAAHEAEVARRAYELITLTGGGAFVLSTSLKGMRALAASLRASGLSPLVQGEAPKAELLDRFRAHGHAVLVATLSFWEGVDVPGQALRLVIMDKIPFPVPSDPVLGARARRIEREGGNAFTELFLPQAAITLRQGFGRLLRTQTDAGIVAVLDPRLMRMGYGRILLAALPDTQRATRLEDVSRFWRRINDDPMPDV